jgi:hypothetical protein
MAQYDGRPPVLSAASKTITTSACVALVAASEQPTGSRINVCKFLLTGPV